MNLIKKIALFLVFYFTSQVALAQTDFLVDTNWLEKNINNPIINEIITATKPIEIETLEPRIILLNMSLPYLSVPKKKVFSFMNFNSNSLLSFSFKKLLTEIFFWYSEKEPSSE